MDTLCALYARIFVLMKMLPIVFHPSMSEAVASSAVGDSAVDQRAFLHVSSTLHVMVDDNVFWFGDLSYRFVRPIADPLQFLFCGCF